MRRRNLPPRDIEKLLPLRFEVVDVVCFLYRREPSVPDAHGVLRSSVRRFYPDFGHIGHIGHFALLLAIFLRRIRFLVARIETNECCWVSRKGCRRGRHAAHPFKVFNRHCHLTHP